MHFYSLFKVTKQRIKMQCAYVYKKGAMKNQQCPIKPYNGLKYCHRHKKYNNVENNNIETTNDTNVETTNDTNEIKNNKEVVEQKVEQDIEPIKPRAEEPKSEENKVEILTLPRP